VAVQRCTPASARAFASRIPNARLRLLDDVGHFTPTEAPTEVADELKSLLQRARRRATVSENAVQVGSEVLVGTPKAHKQRSVPLPEFLLPYLARQCERWAATICCSRATTAGTSNDRTPRAGGSSKPLPDRACRG